MNNKKRLIKLFQSLILLALLNSCNGQSIDDCKSHYNNARKKLNTFYTQKNEKILLEILTDVEISLQCPETRKGSIELKITIFSFQKEYKKGYLYIKSIDESDFSKVYKKEMEYNLFKALDFESKTDIVNRNFYLNKSIKAVKDFIDRQKTIDQEAYYDLYFIKSKLINDTEMKAEIDELEKKYPKDQDFFELLKESFNENAKEANAIRN